MTVVNIASHTPTPNDQYIGRGNILGNPFKIGIDGDRQEVIKKYEEYAKERLSWDETFKRAILACEGKTLICFCKPLSCHGDVIEMLIEEYKEN